MCLKAINNSLTKKYKNRKRLIKAYKIIRLETMPGTKTEYFSLRWGYPNLKLGENIPQKGNEGTEMPAIRTSQTKEFYIAGFHSLLGIESLKRYKSYFSHTGRRNRVIEVFIDPQDVICVGRQVEADVIVSKKMIIKSFKKVPLRKVTKKVDAIKLP